jgi:phage tail-like protein
MSITPDQLFSDAPATASARRYLSRGLPAVYREPEVWGGPDPFVVRWMAGLEEVLDPTVALIDNLAWHLDARLAPEEIVRMLLRWLGLFASAELPEMRARYVLERAERITRMRGTMDGIRLALETAFPELEFDITDGARFTEGDDPYTRPDVPEPPLLDVTWWDRDGRPPFDVDEQDLRAIIGIHLPVELPYSLRERTAWGADSP